MCILFSYISRRLKPGEFKLILLNNRDEYFHRAAKSASFVNENNIYGKIMVKFSFLNQNSDSSKKKNLKTEWKPHFELKYLKSYST